MYFVLMNWRTIVPAMMIPTVAPAVLSRSVSL